MKRFYCIFRPEVLATLTTDVGRILSKLHQVQPKGYINLCTGIRVAHVCNLSYSALYWSINFNYCETF